MSFFIPLIGSPSSHIYSNGLRMRLYQINIKSNCDLCKPEVNSVFRYNFFGGSARRSYLQRFRPVVQRLSKNHICKGSSKKKLIQKRMIIVDDSSSPMPHFPLLISYQYCISLIKYNFKTFGLVFFLNFKSKMSL